MYEAINALKVKLQQHPWLYGTLRSLRHRVARQQIPPHRNECLRRIQVLEQEVQLREAKSGNVNGEPVLFFVASQHTNFFGLGAAIGLLSSFALRLSGQRVVYYVCKQGLSQCVLGSNRQGIISDPPCDSCISYRNTIYPLRHTLELRSDPVKLQALRAELSSLTWLELQSFTRSGWNFGALCLPSLRWIERRFELRPNEFRQHMLREYILSAILLAEDFARLLSQVRPLAVVVYNGTTYPEAVVRRVARERGVRVVSYEVGFNNASAFFSHGVSTEYAIRLPQDFTMGSLENTELDSYLARRFRGNFTQAGVRFWSSMRELPSDLAGKINAYPHVVTIFTNVTWDTSQAYAHAFFSSMIEWLDSTLQEAIRYPDTLFIVRAHPHDKRREKPSNEPVEDWLSAHGYLGTPNLLFVPPESEISSYELIALSKCCLVYNSTIGLEAAAMGKYTLSGAWTRYRGMGICYDIASKEDYCSKFRELMERDESSIPPPEWRLNARRYFYFSLFKASLDFSGYVDPIDPPHFLVRNFPAQALVPQASVEMQVIVNGILQGSDFYYA